MFQQCYGANKPEPEELINWYTCEEKSPSDEMNIANNLKHASPLNFKGKLLPASTDPEELFNDWGIIAIANCMRFSGAVPAWQWWRIHQRVWSPNSALLTNETSFSCQDNCLSFTENGHIIALWKDWTEGLSERLADHIPPSTGQFVEIKRGILNRFLSNTDFTFCWVCRLTGYYKEEYKRSHKEFSTYKIFGASNIIRVS
jgi:hypothetical protein